MASWRSTGSELLASSEANDDEYDECNDGDDQHTAEDYPWINDAVRGLPLRFNNSGRGRAGQCGSGGSVARKTDGGLCSGSIFCGRKHKEIIG